MPTRIDCACLTDRLLRPDPAEPVWSASKERQTSHLHYKKVERMNVLP